jgi:hypothetical protein
MQVLTPISWNNPPVGGRNDATDFSPNLELCRVFVATTLSHIYLQFMAISLQYHEDRLNISLGL